MDKEIVYTLKMNYSRGMSAESINSQADKNQNVMNRNTSAATGKQNVASLAPFNVQPVSNQ